MSDRVLDTDPRVVEQRRRAAQKATRVRSRRAAVKARIAAGEVDLAELLEGESIGVGPTIRDVAEEIRIGELLRSVPGIGPLTAREILEAVDVGRDCPLCDVSPERREAIAKRLATEEE